MLLAHPSAELYGADRVALESARAFVQEGWQVHATLTDQGPLVALLESVGCTVDVQAAPVLRKAYLSPFGLVRFAVRTIACTPAMVRLLRRTRPEVVYVSTVTVPWWLPLARLFGARVVCHVHEAEQDVPRVVRTALALPLLLAHRVIANSRISLDVVLGAVPRLRDRCAVIDNGVPGPATTTPPRLAEPRPVRLVLVGRVSPRKGTDVAVAALAVLTERGVPATLDLVGGVFTGYEWFEHQVRAQVAEHGLEQAVRWRGVLDDVWAALDAADVVLVPSRVEPFGNAAVEAMLAARPVIVSDVQGLREIVRSGQNGELVPPEDPVALADAVEAVVSDWPAVGRRALAARDEAQERFAPGRYHRRIAAAVDFREAARFS